MCAAAGARRWGGHMASMLAMGGRQGGSMGAGGWGGHMPSMLAVGECGSLHDSSVRSAGFATKSASFKGVSFDFV